METRTQIRRLFLLTLAVFAQCLSPSRADEPPLAIEVTNQTDETIRFRVSYADENYSASKEHVLEPQMAQAFTGDRPLLLKFQSGSKPLQYVLTPGHRYHLYPSEAGIDLARTLPAGDDEKAGVRELRVLAMADGAYQRKFPQWAARIRGLLGAVSEHFEANFDIRLNVTDCKGWTRPSLGPNSRPALAELMQVDAGDAELVIGFTMLDVPQRSGSVELGVTNNFGQYVVIHESTLSQIAARAQIIVLHELCHVFGAFHVPDRRSVMQPNADTVPHQVSITALTRKIVRLTRNVDLRQGVESLDEESARQLTEIFRQHRDPASTDDDPISVGYGYQAQRALVGGDANRAQRMANQILTRSPRSIAAQMLLGAAALVENNASEAETRFRQAIQLKPNLADAHVGLGVALMAKGELRAALQALEQALRLDPNNPLAQTLRDMCRQFTNTRVQSGTSKNPVAGAVR